MSLGRNGAVYLTSVQPNLSSLIPFVGWRKDIWKGAVLVSHGQFSHLQLSNEGGLCFLLTIVYAANKREEKKSLWDGLISISDNPNNLPWVALGDFNEITYPEERIPQGDYNHGVPSEFIDATMSSHLIELPSMGGSSHGLTML